MTACPSPLPRWWDDFTAWREHGGIPAERPGTVPRAVPAWAWPCYRAQHPKPARSYGVLAESGFFVREPTGGNETEKVPAVKAAGFSYLALNVGDYRLKQWETWRILAAQAGLECLPWARVYVGTDVRALESDAFEMNAAGMALNIENEAESSLEPGVVSLLTKDYKGSLAIVTDYRGWVDQHGYHGPQWDCLADRAVGVIESFSSDGVHIITVAASQLRAQLAGFKKIVPMLGALQGKDAYGPVVGPRAVYTLDTVDAKEVAKWAA